MTRRRFVALGGGAIASLSFGGVCRPASGAAAAEDGRLTARPRAGAKTFLESGRLELARGDRDGIVQIPTAAASGAVPLLVFLHGATQNGGSMLSRIGGAAERLGIAVLTPDSRGRTWDGITGPFDEDVAFLDRALALVFERLAVDPARVAIGGFSDGASYALSLGLGNGDLFRHVIAFSPGFAVPPRQLGTPRIFMCHGTQDRVLPIDRCSRRLVRVFERAGYDVNYREFDGPHVVPEEMMREAVHWWLNGTVH
jgi:phospholipase/carboxylesterase